MSGCCADDEGRNFNASRAADRRDLCLVLLTNLGVDRAVRCAGDVVGLEPA